MCTFQGRDTRRPASKLWPMQGHLTSASYLHPKSVPVPSMCGVQYRTPVKLLHWVRSISEAHVKAEFTLC